MDIGLKIVGTLLFGGPLLNFIIPIIVLIISEKKNHNEQNEMLWGLNGKIKRKWFFLNSIILFIIFIILSALCFLLRNWIMLIICVPYFLILYLLHWNNVYKRLNDVSDNHKLCLYFTVIIAIICLFSKIIYDKISTPYLPIGTLLFWFFLFVLPSHKKGDM